MSMYTAPFLVALLVACGGAPPPAPTYVDDLDPAPFSEGAAPTSVDDAFTLPLIADDPTLKLRPLTVTDAGQEPRAVLARRIEVGHREALDLTLEASSDGVDAPTTLHGTVFEVLARRDDRLAVRSVIDRSDVRIDNPKVTKHDRASLAERSLGKRADGVVTLGGTWLSYARRDSAVSQQTQITPATMSDGARGVIPLPDVPVGVGARWTVGSTQTTDDMVSVTEITYQLVSRDADGAVIDVDLRIDATPTADGKLRKVEASVTARSRSRARVTLDRLTATVTGELTLEIKLGRIVRVSEMRWTMVPRATP